MENVQLALSKSVFELLQNHLKLSSKLTDFNKEKLLQELNSAKVFKDEELPADAITLHSLVEIEEIETKQKFTFKLVNPAEANMKYNKLSVFAPIGIALLGYRTGSEVQWEMPTGLKKFKVVSVTHQEPEKANV
ncbi:MAG TPA: GreA/GreB family elongation factor [Daejeonella sp.]|nr:GreA/GreB family elongation factor [Daejeonella sp.]